MKVKRRKNVVWLSLILISAAAVGWLFRPYPAIDEAKVHPSLRGLNASTRCETTSFGDGGSLAIHVVRPDGTEVDLCLSNSLDHSFSERGQLYVGASHFSMPGATRITGYDHTRYVVARLLARNAATEASHRGDIFLLTQRVSDWLSFAIHDGPLEAFEELRIRF